MILMSDDSESQQSTQFTLDMVSTKNTTVWAFYRVLS